MIKRVQYSIRSKIRSLTRHGLSHAFPLVRGRIRIVVLMYHEVLEDDRDLDAWTVLRESEFRKQMEYLKGHYDVVSLGAARDLMKGGDRSRAKYAVVTFDDGYEGNRRVVLPVMVALNLPFTVFCTTGSIEQGEPYWWDRVIHSALSCRARITLTDMPRATYNFEKRLSGEAGWNEIQRLLTDLKSIEREKRERIIRDITRQSDEWHQSVPLRPMTPKQVRELSDAGLATIGAHSQTHDILTQITREEAEDSILRSKEKLEAWTGRRVDYFSYPNGDYSPALMYAVKRAGFLAAVSTEERTWTLKDDIYAIPRIGVGRFDSLAQFKTKVSCAN